MWIKWAADFVKKSEASKRSCYCFRFWQRQSRAKLGCPAWGHLGIKLPIRSGVRWGRASPPPLSVFKPHPRSLGTEDGQVSHWPGPEGNSQGKGIVWGLRASKGKKGSELNPAQTGRSRLPKKLNRAKQNLSELHTWARTQLTRSCPTAVRWDLRTHRVLRTKAAVRHLCFVPRLGEQEEGTGVSQPNFRQQKNVGPKGFGGDRAESECQSPGP